MALRIVFMGTPDFSVPSFEALYEQGHDIVACYSQPPRPAGRRGLELKQSPVHAKAVALGIPVFTPESLKSETEQASFSAHKADVAVVIAYGLLLPKAILDAPKHGCFNGHASLLPRWRGAAPIQRAIMAGDTQTGVGIMKMDVGLDTGDVAIEERVPVGENTTAGQLHDELATLTAKLMCQAMSELEKGKLTLTPQPEDGIVYAHKILKDETRIDWAKSAQDVHNHIRGLSPFPGSWCEMIIGGKSQRVKVLASELAAGSGNPGLVLDEKLTIACGEGAVRLVRVQRAGKQAQDAGEFLHGNIIDAVV